MSAFERPQVWVAAVPWVVFCLWLAWMQATARSQARRRVAPRFLLAVTRYTRGSLALHHLALAALGLVLLSMVAEPVQRERSAVGAGGGRVLLLFDASASMYATDVKAYDASSGEEPNRFEIARSVGRELVTALEDLRFGIVSFSGTATLHLPMTADRELLKESLAALETHTYYQNTGSSLARALEMVYRFTTGPGVDAAGLQVVLLGDGELPFEESYLEPLTGLADLGVKVHAVAIGSVEGQERVIYDFRDVVAGKDEKRVLVEYNTRRVDEHYREVAAATGGRFLLAERPSVQRLAAEIRTRAAAPRPVEEDEPPHWTAWLPLVALAGCFGHLLFLTPLRNRRGAEFDLERLGTAPPGAGVAVLVLMILPMLVWGCGDSPRQRAHRANERGLALDDLGQHAAARSQFERSAGVGFQPEIPIHNLARSLARRERFTEAHRLFQRALELEPDLVDAAFNDGVTLYDWGRAERDPRDCQLERTLELWQSARSRFAAITGGVVERDEPARRAGANLVRLDSEIAAIERLIAEPPEHCAGAAGGGGEEGDGQGGGEADGEGGGGGAQDPPPGATPPPAEPPPVAPPSGPLTAEERAQIATELERIARQVSGEGRFYRRTRSEQFSREDWSKPQAVIWW